MTTARIIIAGIILVLAAYIALMNWGCVIASLRNQKKGIDKHHSTIPGISLILAGVAYFIYPLNPKLWIGFIPGLDIGTWMLVIGLPWAIAKGDFKNGPENKTLDRTS